MEHTIGDLLRGEAEVLPHGGGHQGGIDHVLPQSGDLRLELAPRGGHLTGEPALAVAAQVAGPVVQALRRPHPQEGEGQLARQGVQQGIVPVDDGQASFLAWLKISLLASRIFSREPKYSMWESPMLVIRITSGSTIAER